MALAMFSTAMRMKPSAISSGARPSPTSRGELGEGGAHRLGVERLIARRAEDLREELRVAACRP